MSSCVDLNKTLTVLSDSSVAVWSFPEYSAKQLAAVYYVTWVCYPILLTCCSIGNVLNLIVLAHERSEGSTKVYMMAVAVCDLFILWLYMPLYLYNVSPTLRHNTPTFIKAFFGFYGLQRWGQETFITLCDWILIKFSLERLLAITMPFSFQVIHTARTARIATALFLGLAGLFTLYNVVEQYWMYYHDTTCIPSWMVQWKSAQVPAELAMTIFKFFALLIINCLIIIVIGRQRVNSAKIQLTAHSTHAKRTQQNSTLLLLGSTVLYLVTQFPQLVVNCILCAAHVNAATLIFPISAKQFASPIVDMFMLANYSVNFFLYLTVSKRFRDQFVEVFGKYLCTSRQLDRNQADKTSADHEHISTSSNDTARGGRRSPHPIATKIGSPAIFSIPASKVSKMPNKTPCGKITVGQTTKL